jgi:hypothetical protein
MIGLVGFLLLLLLHADEPPSGCALVKRLIAQQFFIFIFL